MSKYRNQKCRVYGILFDSKREAERYLILRQMEIDGEISCLRLQPKFEIKINGERVTTYRADFSYMQAGMAVVEDAKGYRTAVYRLKRKLMIAVHGIHILET